MSSRTARGSAHATTQCAPATATAVCADLSSAPEIARARPKSSPSAGRCATSTRQPRRVCADQATIALQLPVEMPDTARRWVTRVPPDPYLRIDTNDYSLEPALVGRRVEVRADQRQIRAIALDTGEIACQHARSFAKHRTITALQHARALRDGRQPPTETQVEVRPLARYDALIA